MRGSFIVVLAAAMPLLGSGMAAASSCDDATLAAARAAVDAECSCGAATNHGGYVVCVDRAVDELVDSGLLPRQCRGDIIRCAANSTCGKSGAVTCCRTDRHGHTRCSIKNDARNCRAPKGGTACTSTGTVCCNACVDDGLSCGGGGTTTTTAPSTTTTTAPTTTTTAPTTSTTAPTTTTTAPTTTSTVPTTTTTAPTTTSTTTTEPTTTTTTSTTTTTAPGSPSPAFLD